MAAAVSAAEALASAAAAVLAEAALASVAAAVSLALAPWEGVPGLAP